MSAEAGVSASKHVDYALRAKRKTEGEIETVRQPGVGGSGGGWVRHNLCGTEAQFIPSAPPDFSELLMFVIKCITLEDSDWERGKRGRERKKSRNLYGTNIDNSWLLGIGEEGKDANYVNEW